MWKLDELQKHRDMTCINGQWVLARPENYKRRYMPIGSRIRHAWAVFMCRAEAFVWPGGQ